MILSFMELGALIKFATIWFLFYEREFKNIKSTLWILNSLMFFESWITLSTDFCKRCAKSFKISDVGLAIDKNKISTLKHQSLIRITPVNGLFQEA